MLLPVFYAILAVLTKHLLFEGSLVSNTFSKFPILTSLDQFYQPDGKIIDRGEFFGISITLMLSSKCVHFLYTYAHGVYIKLTVSDLLQIQFIGTNRLCVGGDRLPASC